MSRVGYDNTIGFLDGGLEAWTAAGEEVDTIEEISPAEFAAEFENIKNPLDVRRASEYSAEHIEGVKNFPLDFINANMTQLNRNEKYVLHCASGYRSVIAASILKARGFEQVVNVPGGFKALVNTALPRTDYVAQCTEL